MLGEVQVDAAKAAEDPSCECLGHCSIRLSHCHVPVMSEQQPWETLSVAPRAPQDQPFAMVRVLGYVCSLRPTRKTSLPKRHCIGGPWSSRQCFQHSPIFLLCRNWQYRWAAGDEQGGGRGLRCRVLGLGVGFGRVLVHG